MTADLAPVRSWCFTHDHRIEVVQDSTSKLWTLVCRTCQEERERS